MKKGKVFLVLVLAALVASYFVFDLGRFLSLDYIKAQQEAFRGLYAEHAFAVMGGYFVIYVLVTALSVPGAAVMTLLGGALFGFWRGLVLVSFASSLGATLACFASRYVLRDWVQGKLGEKLETINRGVEKEGAFYLFTMRLIPIFPFFAINLLMGLTPMPLLRYYWVSQLGMLPGTMVYVNAGKELGQLSSLAGILSPSLLVSFALLGLFPLLTKKIMGVVQRHRKLPPQD
ncbi:TVP38/TMEM64 family protein [Desulfobaculum bizertense]|uniref:TVP38/TMEM64 family protein n=1 Tax=Desulfobaculum bizertense TaxID=376490 RepID=UPI001F186399|nr:TVP38/TMEM64 family protein [Desulfobaculum bizertense]UIJ37273.1 TVP38/TMEM64 family protein [Desulfobaculum bizertense]